MSDVKSIVAENEELKKLLDDTKESLKGYEKDYDEICEELDLVKAELEAFKAESASEEKDEDASDDMEDAEDDEMEANEEEASEEPQESAEEAQAKVLAKALRQLGVVEPVVTKPKAQKMSNEEVLAKFASITDAKERGEFYAKNRTQIFN